MATTNYFFWKIYIVLHFQLKFEPVNLASGHHEAAKPCFKGLPKRAHWGGDNGDDSGDAGDHDDHDDHDHHDNDYGYGDGALEGNRSGDQIVNLQWISENFETKF